MTENLSKGNSLKQNYEIGTNKEAVPEAAAAKKSKVICLSALLGN